MGGPAVLFFLVGRGDYKLCATGVFLFMYLNLKRFIAACVVGDVWCGEFSPQNFIKGNEGGLQYIDFKSNFYCVGNFFPDSGCSISLLPGVQSMLPHFVKKGLSVDA